MGWNSGTGELDMVLGVTGSILSSGMLILEHFKHKSKHLISQETESLDLRLGHIPTLHLSRLGNDDFF